jgi:hypothetical protein
MRVVRTLYDRERKRKVEIHQAEDGTFGYTEWAFVEEHGYWALAPKRTNTKTDTLERAVSEACGRIAWLDGENSRPTQP